MKTELLKYCKYYKGYGEPPADKDYDTFKRFWYLEEEYYDGEYEQNHEYWENEGQKFCEEPQFLKDFVGKIKDKTIKGFVAYATTMSYSHSPMDGVHFILNYKYD